MQLRSYQEEVLKQLDIRLRNEKEVVIASAPSSGKTMMIIKFIKNNPSANFLILTHGTVVLKEQWRREFTTHGVNSSSVLGQFKVTFGLPQGIHKKELKKAKIDFLIIDEAHEFTFAKMAQKIIKESNPKKIIYLTGTPSKFIKKGYDVIIVPASRLIEEGHVSDLYVGMVSTVAKLSERDYNQDGDAKLSGDRKLENSTEADLDSLLSSLHKRLCETKFFKGNPTARKTVEWAPTLGALHKTMIACNSIHHCQNVEKYFRNRGISVVSSDSINDPNSENIQRFIDEKDVKVLVVVNRGTLGFNLPELVNVVDLTCSRNIDRIYQLYARAMRKNDNYTQKYFFKFSPDDHMVLMKFYMEASLSLLFEEFISKYNGKNLNGFEIPHLKSIKRKQHRSTTSVDKKRKSPERPVPIDELFSSSVSALKLLTPIYNKVGNSYNEYAFMTFDKIKGIILDRSNIPWTFEECMENAQQFISRSEWAASKTGYQAARIRGWAEECCAHMDRLHRPNNYWSKKRCAEEAIKYKTLDQWRKNNGSSYVIAKNKNWIQECTSHMTRSHRFPKNYWSKENCLKEAKKYKTKIDWKAESASSYNAAILKGWIDECSEHMSSFFIWTDKANCLKEAKKYKTITEWLSNSSGSYQASNKYGWSKECSAHMNKNKISKNRKFVINVDTGKIFSHLKPAAQSIGRTDSLISSSIRAGLKAGGYTWAYCDENGNIIKQKKVS